MMFELMQAVEEVKKMTGISRKVYQSYLRKKLDKYFFNKFSKDSLQLSYAMMSELLCLKETSNLDLIDKVVKENNIPIIKDIYIHSLTNLIRLKLKFYDYDIELLAFPEEFHWTININYKYKGLEKTLSIHPNINIIEVSPFKSIIFMCIYNYCVLYVYDNETLLEKNYNRLLKDDDKSIQRSLKILTEEGIYYA